LTSGNGLRCVEATDPVCLRGTLFQRTSHRREPSPLRRIALPDHLPHGLLRHGRAPLSQERSIWLARQSRCSRQLTPEDYREAIVRELLTARAAFLLRSELLDEAARLPILKISSRLLGGVDIQARRLQFPGSEERVLAKFLKKAVADISRSSWRFFERNSSRQRANHSSSGSCEIVGSSRTEPDRLSEGQPRLIA
jgi:hypothetical protein